MIANMVFAEASSRWTGLAFNLLSGMFGAALATFAAWKMHRDTKDWTLQAELKRYRVNRITASAQVLRSCFFRAKTNLEYHHADLVEDEEIRRAPNLIAQHVGEVLGTTAGFEQTVEEWKRRSQNREAARQQYNSLQSSIEAEARSNVAILAACEIPGSTLTALQQELLILAEGRTTDSDSVAARIQLYRHHEPTVLQRIRETEAFAESLIKSK